ncbi:unnamed protein product [Pseudo-nitzschia multistriata]|uniref:Uncharacterized protein n=1 Tax=Pseudo-nitzschia multistriata TaxID=183589 RepID=A0A448ZHB1_9STRA|nr:unnamed protein product [Pseudo-nitzschia multistriata]
MDKRHTAAKGCDESGFCNGMPEAFAAAVATLPVLLLLTVICNSSGMKRTASAYAFCITCLRWRPSFWTLPKFPVPSSPPQHPKKIRWGSPVTGSH